MAMIAHDGRGYLLENSLCRGGNRPGLYVQRLTCECGRITDYPFTLLLQRKGVTRETFIGNIGFRCQKCGGTEPKIGGNRSPRPVTDDLANPIT
jgi:hypothetical protein